ncbi:ATP-dependent helicase [Haloferax sp. ATB1]|uniref:ATP-dependent helicase n=1 Tax=Haloferax sp. ATB1 TaxID=1508454 RepID=UPI0005B1D1AA|nr:ATP-dependent helicase [Haloferax sp. ATB1]
MSEDTNSHDANEWTTTNSHDANEWTTTRLLDEMERINRERSGNDDWSFDEEQRAAIQHGNGPLYLTAGPGSGKSEVVVTRGLKLLVVEDVDPRSIVLTTFTEKAAENLRDRLDDRIDALGLSDEIDTADIWVGTMHELAADIMREYHHAGYRNIELLDGDAQQMFIRTHSDFVNFLAGDEVMDDWEATADIDHVEDGEQWRWFSGAMKDPNDQYGPNKFEATRTAVRLFNRLSQYQVDVNALANSGVPYLRVLAEAYEQYLEALQDARRCDFARLQEEFLEFLDSDAGETFLHGDDERDRPPLEHVLVDEYQDVNPLQEEIYLRITENMSSPNITVVGDDDQSLYRFRGATVDCFIQFPETASERLNISEGAVQRIQLRHNYRSEEDIVQWNNDFMSNHLTMQEDGARADGKMPMVPTRNDGDDPRVKLLKGPNAQATADRLADTIEAMHDEGYIRDYSQVALLFGSTRERWTQWGGSPTFVGRVVQALKARDIPVHNPRNKAFMEHQETQLLIAALARCIDPGLQWASDRLMGSVADDFWEWQDTLDNVLDSPGGDELRAYLNETSRAVQDAEEGSVLNRSPLDVFLRVRSCSPISEWTQGPNRDPARAKRLGRLTDLLESFVSMADGVTGDRKLTRTTHNLYGTVSTRFLGQFYYTFCQYLSSMGLDDPEDEYNQIPSGYVQVMTVHQAKGLEFPVVFAGNLHYTPRTGSTYWLEERFRPYAHRGPVAPGDVRAERDLIRQFYVATHARKTTSCSSGGTTKSTSG